MKAIQNTPNELPLLSQLLDELPSGVFMIFNEQAQCWIRATHSRLGDGLTLRMEKIVPDELPPRPHQPSFEATRQGDAQDTAWPCLNPWSHGVEGWWSE